MASKVFNLDDLITDSIQVNIGDPCPFCKGKNPYMNDPSLPGNDFTKHIVDVHKPEFAYIIGKEEKE